MKSFIKGNAIAHHTELKINNFSLILGRYAVYDVLTIFSIWNRTISHNVVVIYIFISRKWKSWFYGIKKKKEKHDENSAIYYHEENEYKQHGLRSSLGIMILITIFNINIMSFMR